MRAVLQELDIVLNKAIGFNNIATIRDREDS